MKTVRPTHISVPNHHNWLNQNRVFDRQLDEDGMETLQRSYAFEDVSIGDVKTGYWSVANIDFSRDAKNYCDLSILFTTVGSYFESIDSTTSRYLGRGLNALSGWFFGSRDDTQYRVLGRGAGHKLSDEERKNQELSVKKTLFDDDLKENEYQRVKYGEWLTAYLGRAASATAKIKPIAYFMGDLMGGGIGFAVRTLVDIPASLWWRVRMFAPALHANFATTMFWDLPTLGIKSIFSSEGKKRLNEKLSELNTLAGGSYFAMLKNRMKGHWEGIWNPEKAYDEKVKGGVLKERDELELGSTREERIKEQRRYSCMDFTGPISAAFGVLTLGIFGPIRAVMTGFGIERGQSFVNTIFSLRKLTHLGNYAWRFIIPELKQSGVWKEYEKLVYPENGKSSANDLVKEYYYAAKSRHYNALFNGIGMIALNAVEPFLHMFSSRIPEGIKPFVNAFMRIDEAVILKFFSGRRTDWGRMKFVQSLVKSKLEEKGQKLTNLREQMQTIKMTNGEISRAATKVREKMLDRDSEENEARIIPIDQGARWVSNKWNKIKGMIQEVGVLGGVA